MVYTERIREWGRRRKSALAKAMLSSFMLFTCTRALALSTNFLGLSRLSLHEYTKKIGRKWEISSSALIWLSSGYRKYLPIACRNASDTCMHLCASYGSLEETMHELRCDWGHFSRTLTIEIPIWSKNSIQKREIVRHLLSTVEQWTEADLRP